MEVSKALQQGITSIKEGKLQEAERIYYKILHRKVTL